MKLLTILRRRNPTPIPATSKNPATLHELATEQQSSCTAPAQLLVSHKSTPASIAAVGVDEALRSAVGSDLLHAVDSAIGEVFYSVVYKAVYIRSWCAVFATWRASVPPVADREVGIKSALSAPPTKPREEAPKKRVQAEMRKCDGWMRSTTTTIIALAVAVLAGFARSYSSRAPHHPANIAAAQSPEIRRAIPVEPEIRRAIPVQTSERKVERRSKPMAFTAPGRAIPRLQHDGRPPSARRKKSIHHRAAKKKRNP